MHNLFAQRQQKSLSSLSLKWNRIIQQKLNQIQISNCNIAISLTRTIYNFREAEEEENDNDSTAIDREGNRTEESPSPDTKPKKGSVNRMRFHQKIIKLLHRKGRRKKKEKKVARAHNEVR